MSQPLRIEHESAWYHVMNRGVGRMKIFTSDEHRHVFLKTLEEAVVLYQIEILSYCLI